MNNPQLENGYLKVANEIAEALSRTKLSGNESRILWAIFRKTYGFNKKEDWISYSQFRDLTGMIDPHICRTLKRLIERKIVTKNGKSYSFNKNYQDWQVELPKRVTRVTQTGKKKLPKLVDTKDKPKDTIQKTLLQKTGTPYQKMLSFIESCETRNESFNLLMDYLADKGLSREIAEQEVLKFCNYWTELNSSGRKQRWQLEKTFQVERRLMTWFSRIKNYNNKEKKGVRI